MKPLLPGEVNPYVVAIIHQYWEPFDKLYRIFQEVDRVGDSFPNGVHNLSESPIYPLGLVNCAYYPHNRALTIYVMRDGHGHMPGYSLWNGILQRKEIMHGWAYEDLLYNLLRVYSALAGSANMCSTPVHPPTGHDMADSLEIVRMIQNWKTIL